jgi:hypothetical protein
MGIDPGQRNVSAQPIDHKQRKGIKHTLPQLFTFPDVANAFREARHDA